MPKPGLRSCPAIRRRSYDLSRCHQAVVRGYIRVGRFEDASKELQELWKHPRSDTTVLYRAQRDLIEDIEEVRKTAEAKAETACLFDEHSRWIPNLKSLTDSTYSSKLAIAIGQRKWVPELLTKSETLMTADQVHLYVPQFAGLWRLLGDEKHAAELMAKYKQTDPH